MNVIVPTDVVLVVGSVVVVVVVGSIVTGSFVYGTFVLDPLLLLVPFSLVPMLSVSLSLVHCLGCCCCCYLLVPLSLVLLSLVPLFCDVLESFVARETFQSLKSVQNLQRNEIFVLYLYWTYAVTWLGRRGWENTWSAAIANAALASPASNSKGKLIKLKLDTKSCEKCGLPSCVSSESTCELWKGGRVGATVSTRMGTSIKMGCTRVNSLLARAVW